jgi:ferredoxin
MRVRVDQERCIGSGQCVALQPAVFDQDEDEGYVVLVDKEPGETLLDGVRRAEKSCPVGAITLGRE